MSIKVEKLVHIYDKNMPNEQTALNDINFEVQDGEILGIIGHTGSGKSTLLQHLNGLLKPDSGTIYIGEADITKKGISMVEIRKKVGLVFQYPEYQLFEETVEKDVAFGPKNLGLNEEEQKERVKEALSYVELDYDTVKDRSPFDLSGGQKRRVAIAGVIAMRPDVLILDEPTAGLDPKSHRDILKMIRDIHDKTGNITIFVSHNMQDVADLSDKILVIDSGKLVLAGTPKQVFSRSELLNSIGLEVPPITRFMNELGATSTIMNMDDAVKEIKLMLGYTK